jgi:anti-sigma regulatory factor (Ser/Thr protein kinase)
MIVAAAESPAVLELEPDTMSNVSTARRFVAAALDGHAPKQVVGDLQLAASELVTNALEHGAAEPVVVSVNAGDHAASLRVTSHQRPNTQIADVSHWHIADPERLAGRGLGIVRALADELDVSSEGDALVITVLRRW